MKKLYLISIILAFITINVNSQTNTFPSTGNVGIGTTNPNMFLHLKKGDTPTIRLEQDNTLGWTAQTWDILGNESNFIIRDMTNGSSLPFRIFPGTLTNTLILKPGGKVGIGKWAPETTLDVLGSIRMEYDSVSTLSAGMMRYYKNDFAGYNGSNWVSFTKSDSLTILNLQNQIDLIQARLDACCSMKAPSIEDPIDNARLEQNNPNPFNQNTDINFYLPQNVHAALLIIHDMSGKQLEKFTISERGESKITIQSSMLSPGMYSYTLLLDGKIFGTKRMILTD